MHVEAVFLTDPLVQQIAQKAGDAYDIMGEIVKYP
jgi:hypothetical protein